MNRFSVMDINNYTTLLDQNDGKMRSNSVHKIKTQNSIIKLPRLQQTTLNMILENINKEQREVIKRSNTLVFQDYFEFENETE